MAPLSVLPTDHAAVLASLRQFCQFSPTEEEAFLATMQLKLVEKGGFLFQEGDVCAEISFLVEGCLRYYYMDLAGEEHTGQFFFEGAWVGDLKSFLTGRPSQQNFQALEPCRVLQIPRQQLEALYDAHKGIERFGRRLAEQVVIGAQSRTASLLKESLEERYLALMRTRPKVLARVPQHIIAGYLGVKPESLSRLRGRLAKAGRD